MRERERERERERKNKKLLSLPSFPSLFPSFPLLGRMRKPGIISQIADRPDLSPNLTHTHTKKKKKRREEFKPGLPSLSLSSCPTIYVVSFLGGREEEGGGRTHKSRSLFFWEGGKGVRWVDGPKEGRRKKKKHKGLRRQGSSFWGGRRSLPPFCLSLSCLVS